MDTLHGESTPGPWEACDGASVTVNDAPVVVPDHVCRRFLDDQGRRVTQFIADCNTALPGSAANARLIAAAPELLEAAVALLGRIFEVYRPEYVESVAALEPRSLLGCAKRLEAAVAKAQWAPHGTGGT